MRGTSDPANIGSRSAALLILFGPLSLTGFTAAAQETRLAEPPSIRYSSSAISFNVFGLPEDRTITVFLTTSSTEPPGNLSEEFFHKKHGPHLRRSLGAQLAFTNLRVE
jgi:hypothetical protein